jgi:thiamine biosynthesis lipoprotein ApbE
MQQATQARYSLESVVSRVNVLENSRPWNFSICFVDVFKNSDTYNRTSSCNYYCMLSHRAPL